MRKWGKSIPCISLTFYLFIFKWTFSFDLKKASFDSTLVTSHARHFNVFYASAFFMHVYPPPLVLFFDACRSNQNSLFIGRMEILADTEQMYQREKKGPNCIAYSLFLIIPYADMKNRMDIIFFSS